MTNKDIYLSPDGMTRYIYTEMVKTGGTVSVPLSAEALRWLPMVEDDDTQLFHVPQNASTLGRHLSQWMKAAKVDKHITFHTSRHTFATLTLSACNDLKLVSELLGHKSVKTTQRYADVMLANKTDAVNRVGAVFAA